MGKYFNKSKRTVICEKKGRKKFIVTDKMGSGKHSTYSAWIGDVRLGGMKQVIRTNDIEEARRHVKKLKKIIKC